MKLNYRFNLLLLLSLFLFVFFCFKIIDLSLKKYTLHDDIIIVPSLIGLSLENIEDTLNYYDLNFIILDSAAYDPNYDRGAILSHTPKEGSQVKPGRKIYLTINPLTVHYIAFPQLINKSLRQSISLLETNTFRIRSLNYVDYFAKDVVRFSKMDEKEVNFSDSLPKFSRIDLYLGNGFEDSVLTPNLIGIPVGDVNSLKEVRQKLHSHSLNIENCVLSAADLEDSIIDFVYKQEPVFNQKVPIGSSVTIWLSDTVLLEKQNISWEGTK